MPTVRESLRVSKKPTRRKGITAREAKNEDYVTQTVEQIKSLRYRTFADQKPWLDGEGNIIWSQWRMRAGEVVFSQNFETCMGVVIVLNIGIIMYEANQDAQCYPEFADNFNDCHLRSSSQAWLYILNMLLNGIYTLECATRLYVERSTFFCNKWNLIDSLTLVAGWMASSGMNIGNVAVLRMFRLVRVVRAVRVLVSIPEFYLLITGLYSSIKAIIFGAMMLVSVILFWAVISVELFHPITSRLDFHQCERCANGFSSIFAASLTLFQQIVAGDAWGTISLPLVEAEPWTAAILFWILITISLGVLNLILAVIVERAAEARENDQEAKLKKKQQDRAKSMEELALLCANMDVNNNGMVSFDELLQGYDELPDFQRLMDVMDIKREDMETVFHVLDSDDSQEVSYLEFCQNLGAFFRRDPVIMQSLVKYSVLEVRKILEKDVLDILNEHTNMLRVLVRRDLQGPKATEGTEGTAGAAGAAAGAPAAAVAAVAANVADGGESQLLSTFRTFRNIEAEMQPLLARAEDLAMTAMLSVNEAPRRISRICQRSPVSQVSPSPVMSTSPASPLPVSAHPSHISGISISVASLYPEFSLSNGSPSIGRDHQHDRLKSEVSEAEIIEVELFDDFDGDLESGSSEPVELDQQFAELSLKFKERIHDAERLQERCQRMLQLMEQSHMGLSSAQRKRASLARMKLHKL